ncbi:LUD domain-containing protein [Mesonia aestuariivivens]|uniref:LUD domain-containing protein n=1 Tax=Mesonia aestuariivivens TaxID=2796128 RepID=A0ABS6W1L4_9FLAO|nr:LUD domain-containing protein [Mesonia aestuariivivens]MBW2961745.1 LUD domain-containing protein [Mesonia aestuariivivens]
MSLFRKLFLSKSKSDKEEDQKDEPRSKYMPEPELPTDENFVYHFKNNGGKFLYCQDQKEVQEIFKEILNENDWNNTDCCCFDDHLKQNFKNFNLNYTTSGEASFFLSTCEYLIGNTGALLISSNQIKEKKLAEIPHNFIIVAATSQLVNTIGEGLRGIKSKSKNRIPSNITTIKTFEDKKESDFMSYGSTSKNVYLLLLEDL